MNDEHGRGVRPIVANPAINIVSSLEHIDKTRNWPAANNG